MSQYFNLDKVNTFILKIPMGKLLFDHKIEIEIFFNFEFLGRKSLLSWPVLIYCP